MLADYANLRSDLFPLNTAVPIQQGKNVKSNPKSQCLKNTPQKRRLNITFFNFLFSIFRGFVINCFGICHLTFLWNLDFEICHFNSCFLIFEGLTRELRLNYYR